MTTNNLSDSINMSNGRQHLQFHNQNIKELFENICVQTQPQTLIRNMLCLVVNFDGSPEKSINHNFCFSLNSISYFLYVRCVEAPAAEIMLRFLCVLHKKMNCSWNTCCLYICFIKNVSGGDAVTVFMIFASKYVFLFPKTQEFFILSYKKCQRSIFCYLFMIFDTKLCSLWKIFIRILLFIKSSCGRDVVTSFMIFPSRTWFVVSILNKAPATNVLLALLWRS